MSPDKKAYLTIMEEIVFRTNVIDGLVSKEINMKYKATQIETMVLQVRMIIELGSVYISSSKSLGNQ